MSTASTLARQGYKVQGDKLWQGQLMGGQMTCNATSLSNGAQVEHRVPSGLAAALDHEVEAQHFAFRGATVPKR